MRRRHLNGLRARPLRLVVGPAQLKEGAAGILLRGFAQASLALIEAVEALRLGEVVGEAERGLLHLCDGAGRVALHAPLAYKAAVQAGLHGPKHPVGPLVVVARQADLVGLISAPDRAGDGIDEADGLLALNQVHRVEPLRPLLEDNQICGDERIGVRLEHGRWKPEARHVRRPLHHCAAHVRRLLVHRPRRGNQRDGAAWLDLFNRLQDKVVVDRRVQTGERVALRRDRVVAKRHVAHRRGQPVRRPVYERQGLVDDLVAGI